LSKSFVASSIIIFLLLAGSILYTQSAPTFNLVSAETIQFSVLNEDGTVVPSTINVPLWDESGANLPPPPMTPNIILYLKNTGDTPVNFTVSIKNLNFPSNGICQAFVEGPPYSSSAFSGFSYASTATSSQVQPNNQIRVAIIGIWATTNTYTLGAPLNYSFDIAISATSSAGTSAQQTIHDSTTTHYPYRWYAPGLASDIAVNGGFESGIAPWQVIVSNPAYSGTLTQSNDAYTGSYGGLFSMTNNPTTGGYLALSESIPAATGQTYTLTFYYKSTMTSFNAMVFCKDAITTDGHDIAYWTSQNLPPTNTWTKVTFPFGPIPSGTVDSQIHFGAQNGITGTLQIDDVSAQLTTQQPTPSPTINPSPTPSPTPTATPNPTATTSSPNQSAQPTATPTNAPSQTTTPTATPNPTQTDASTAPDQASPTPNATPTIPEIPILIVTILAIMATLSQILLRRKNSKTGISV
jgi:hypothetical protein